MIKRILEHCDIYGIEIVSFGLAPNPWGFCFEASEDTPEKAIVQLHRWLDGLTKDQIEELRKEVFG